MSSCQDKNSTRRNASDSKDSSENESSKNFTQHLTKEDIRGVGAKPSIKSRVIPSRYKAAAIEATRKGLSNSSDSSKTKSPLDRSKGRLTLATNSSRSPNFLKPARNGSGPAGKGKPNLRLHSTAVNNSTFFEQTNLTSLDDFSTTIVGGQNRNKETSLASLTQLSDISLISPTFNLAESAATVAPSAAIALVTPAGEKDPDDDFKNFTSEDLKKEYLEYLTWAYIDLKSKEAFEKQVSEAKKQISFLAQLVEQEEDAVSEQRKKSELFDSYIKTMDTYELMKEGLLKLNKTVDPCVYSLKDVSHHLELQMNQMKLENVYMPSDDPVYKDLLNDALRENYETLKDLNSNLHGSRGVLESAAFVFKSGADESEKIGSCLEQSETLASLAIQEASMKLSKSLLVKKVS